MRRDREVSVSGCCRCSPYKRIGHSRGRVRTLPRSSSLVPQARTPASSQLITNCYWCRPGIPSWRMSGFSWFDEGFQCIAVHLQHPHYVSGQAPQLAAKEPLRRVHSKAAESQMPFCRFTPFIPQLSPFRWRFRSMNRLVLFFDDRWWKAGARQQNSQILCKSHCKSSRKRLPWLGRVSGRAGSHREETFRRASLERVQ